MSFEKRSNPETSTLEKSYKLLRRLRDFQTAKKFNISLARFEEICETKIIPGGADIFEKIRVLSDMKERLEERSEGDPEVSEAKLDALRLLLNQGLSEIDLLSPDPKKGG